MKITFKKIQKENIFCEDFLDFDKNNILEFPTKGIVVLYGPNGVGKTSLCGALGCEANTSIEGDIDETEFTSADKEIFHTIPDQNGRNIIKGNTEDFLLGDNIRQERALKNEVDGVFRTILERNLNGTLKSEFNISKKTSKLIKLVQKPILEGYIEDIANAQAKGKNIKIDEFIATVEALEKQSAGEYDAEKYKFLINDIEQTASIIEKIIKIDGDIDPNAQISEIEENDTAIGLLTRFISKDQCVVCDNAISPCELLERKKANRQAVFEKLDEKTKKILSDIIEQRKGVDPFNIKATILSAIEKGNKALITELQDELKTYMEIFSRNINDLFASCLESSELPAKHRQYKTMLETKLEISDDDVLFIKTIVSENIGKSIDVKRDKDNNIQLLLDQTEFINKVRDELHLSTGEQNFISLTFEFLKAKNSSAQIIVLDDPISSFDSIYKNKIAYAILKFLENRKVIILTHNTDLIRLLECQLKDCFRLYLLNNVSDEENGFIEVNDIEREIVLYLDKMLNLFRGEILSEIQDNKTFLISMIPFMRGYAQIIDDLDSKNKLTKLMHGYETEKVDIASLYNVLFGKNNQLFTECEISVEDILDLDINSVAILKGQQYTLLNKTLEHSLMYLYIRLKVEKTLVDLFSINTKRHEQLGQIIDKALRDKKFLRERVFLTSRKTLLNEFNHFEGNLNIFQPAIDISDTALKMEKEGILSVLELLKNSIITS